MIAPVFPGGFDHNAQYMCTHKTGGDLEEEKTQRKRERERAKERMICIVLLDMPARARREVFNILRANWRRADAVYAAV